MDLCFKVLNIITSMYSVEGCEKYDIRSLCSVTACKLPFPDQVSEYLGTAERYTFKVSENIFFLNKCNLRLLGNFITVYILLIWGPVLS
jgi:hypothetical protein